MRKTYLALSIVLSVMLCACGSSSNSNTTAAETTTAAAETQEESSSVESTEETAETASSEETSEAVQEEGFHEQEKVLLDNDIATITLTDEVEDSYYVGYGIIIENKSDMNILVGVDNGSVDGLMTYIDVQNATVASGKKSKSELRIYTKDGDIKSLDDLKNVEGAFNISTNTDGSNSYSGNNERYPFEIKGRVGGSHSNEEDSAGQILLDNDLITIRLGDAIEDSYYVGYGLTLENKSDLYLLVGIDNGSVDGFMTNINVANGTIAPGKKSKTEMRIYTKDSDIKTLEDLKNVEGAFSISTNNDGTNSYSGNNDRYPFSISDAGASNAGSGSETGNNAATVTSEAKSETSENNMIVIGETISTDNWDFTVDNVEFTYELKPRNTSGVYTSYTPEDGKVYIHVDAQYYNKSKKDVCIRDLPVPAADYNDGYKYEGFALADRDDNNFFWVSSYVVCEPLSTCHYHGLIECPTVVEESEEPLYITLKMPNNKLYRYDIR